MGCLYFYSFGVLVSYEVTAAAIVIDYWPNRVQGAIWFTVMIVVIVALNFTPVSVYADIEFWLASTKVIMIFGLLVLSFILFWAGGPSMYRLGFHYWDNIKGTNIVAGAGGRSTALLYS